MSLITKGILIFIFSTALLFGFSLLPDGTAWPLPTPIASAFELMFSYIYYLDPLLPTSTLLQAVAIATAFRVARFVLLPSFLFSIRTALKILT